MANFGSQSHRLTYVYGGRGKPDPHQFFFRKMSFYRELEDFGIIQDSEIQDGMIHWFATCTIITNIIGTSLPQIAGVLLWVLVGDGEHESLSFDSFQKESNHGLERKQADFEVLGIVTTAPTAYVAAVFSD